MAENLSRDQRLLLLRDKKYWINILVNNNFPAVKAKLFTLGYPVTTPQEAYKVIERFWDSGNKDALKTVGSVPYNNNATDGTGGLLPTSSSGGITIFSEDGAGTSGSDTTKGNNFWDFASSAVDTIGGIFGGSKAPVLTGTADQIAQQKLLLDKEAQDSKDSNTKTIIIIVVIFLTLAAIFGGIALYNKNKNKKKD